MKKNGGLTTVAATFQRTGQRQRRDNRECEDVILIRESKRMCIYGLADGQSKKSHCRVGARESLDVAADYIETKGIAIFSGSQFADEIQYEIIYRIKKRLRALASAYQTEISAFSSTIVLFAFDSRTGEYAIIHLGDGCILGVGEEHVVHMLSAPENGITAQHTWLTTSDMALSHLRFRYGNTTEYTRVALMTDGADSLCRGRNIPFGVRRLLGEGTTDEITSFLRASDPLDDSSVVIIDFQTLGLSSSIFSDIS